MDWSEEEKKALGMAFIETMRANGNEHATQVLDGGWYEGFCAIASRAVELAAARGGTMTAAELATSMKELRDTAYNAPWPEEIRAEDMARLDAIERHIAALGARSAVLEGELEDTKKAWSTESLRADGLRERLSAAEEGNRELVRRAQYAESISDMDRREVAHKQRALREAWDDRDEWRKRAEAAEARCATLSAAGQMPAAHADKEGCPHSMIHCYDGKWDCQQCGLIRYPCSPTCTHDDAAKPGHPERVRLLSGSVAKITGLDGTTTEAMGAERVKERSEAVSEELRRPENDADTFVTIPNGVEGVVFTRSQTERYADKRAEAMRAACLEAALNWAQENFGMRPQGLKSAIEGAVP